MMVIELLRSNMDNINVLGIDYGGKRVGLAIGNLQTKMAFPLKVIENKSYDFLIAEIKNVCLQENINLIVLGMPEFARDRHSEQYQKTKDFYDKLNTENIGEVVTEDESFSTQMSDKITKMADDSNAAAVFLQSFLDKK